MNTSLLLASLLVSCCFVYGAPGERHAEKNEEEVVATPRRLVTKSLILNNGLTWGSWGEAEYCPDGSFAMDMEVKFRPYTLLETDETAVNSVKLYCALPDLHPTGYITSTEGDQGDWQGMRLCEAGFLTGMRAQVLEPRGLTGDDVAVQNLQMECQGGPQVITGVEGSSKMPDGDWSAWSRCPEESAICGIEVRYEKSHSRLDDAAVSDISMFCCSLDGRQ